MTRLNARGWEITRDWNISKHAYRSANRRALVRVFRFFISCECTGSFYALHSRSVSSESRVHASLNARKNSNRSPFSVESMFPGWKATCFYRISLYLLHAIINPSSTWDRTRVPRARRVSIFLRSPVMTATVTRGRNVTITFFFCQTTLPRSRRSCDPGLQYQDVRTDDPRRKNARRENRVRNGFVAGDALSPRITDVKIACTRVRTKRQGLDSLTRSLKNCTRKLSVTHTVVCVRNCVHAFLTSEWKNQVPTRLRSIM